MSVRVWICCEAWETVEGRVMVLPGIFLVRFLGAANFFSFSEGNLCLSVL